MQQNCAAQQPRPAVPIRPGNSNLRCTQPDLVRQERSRSRRRHHRSRTPRRHGRRCDRSRSRRRRVPANCWRQNGFLVQETFSVSVKATRREGRNQANACSHTSSACSDAHSRPGRSCLQGLLRQDPHRITLRLHVAYEPTGGKYPIRPMLTSAGTKCVLQQSDRPCAHARPSNPEVASASSKQVSMTLTYR